MRWVEGGGVSVSSAARVTGARCLLGLLKSSRHQGMPLGVHVHQQHAPGGTG